MLTAGHDTTSSSTAGGVAALAAAPDQFTMMKNDRSLIPALVEECVRWTSPLLSFMRTAERDYTLRDQTIRKGDRKSTRELQSLMRISYAVLCLKKKT